PPKVIVTEHRVRKVACENVAGQSPPNQYSWFRNDEILDTSDGNKFVVKGNLLLIFNPDIEDEGVYTCRAEWNANKEHNFDVMKMSSNDVEIFYKEQHGEGTSDYITKRRDFITKEQHKENNGGNGTVALTGRCLCIHKEWKCWLTSLCLCIICLFIPSGCLLDKLRWIFNKGANRSPTENTIVFQVQSPLPSQPPHSILSTDEPLLSSESQKSCHDVVLIEESENQQGHVEELNPSIQIEDISNDDAIVVPHAEEMITRQNESVESLYQKALECCSGLYYHNLDMATTDRLEVLLNPYTDPKPPIKYWKHLANKLGFTDQAILNSLGTYKRFHELLQTQDVSMQTFLEALWTVENDQATKVVCKAVIKMNENRK
ncbi:uncharacterized protein LOC117114247, partial [Anneissia japonica]|uniref:uncharacterized protein LOC117114247 n=1 Tax=Anneissia japonica TaxID=1529436 RepID=UPI0014258802